MLVSFADDEIPCDIKYLRVRIMMGWVVWCGVVWSRVRVLCMLNWILASYVDELLHIFHIASATRK